MESSLQSELGIPSESLNLLLEKNYKKQALDLCIITLNGKLSKLDREYSQTIAPLKEKLVAMFHAIQEHQHQSISDISAIQKQIDLLNSNYSASQDVLYIKLSQLKAALSQITEELEYELTGKYTDKQLEIEQLRAEREILLAEKEKFQSEITELKARKPHKPRFISCYHGNY